jgi:hypothetical protein
MDLLAIHMSSFETCVFKLFAHMNCFLAMESIEYLIYFLTLATHRMYDLQIFSPILSVVSLLIIH